MSDRDRIEDELAELRHHIRIALGSTALLLVHIRSASVIQVFLIKALQEIPKDVNGDIIE